MPTAAIAAPQRFRQIELGVLKGTKIAISGKWIDFMLAFVSGRPAAESICLPGESASEIAGRICEVVIGGARTG
jgi:hypothetical protein